MFSVFSADKKGSKTMKLAGIFLTILFSSLSFAGGHEGNGGVAVYYDDPELGRIFNPTDGWFENHSVPVPGDGDQEDKIGVCELVEETGDKKKGVPFTDQEKRKWKRNLNSLIATLHRRNTVYGWLLYQALKNNRWYFLDLQENEHIVYTQDDGLPIDQNKENDAITYVFFEEKESETYLVRRIWKNYWLNPVRDFTYQKPLTRVVHEALLRFYNYGRINTRGLQRVVVEILRLAGHYRQGDYKAFSRKTTDEISHFFLANGFDHTTKSTSFERPPLSLTLRKRWTGFWIRLDSKLYHYKDGKKRTEKSKIYRRYKSSHNEYDAVINSPEDWKKFSPAKDLIEKKEDQDIPENLDSFFNNPPVLCQGEK